MRLFDARLFCSAGTSQDIPQSWTQLRCAQTQHHALCPLDLLARRWHRKDFGGLFSMQSFLAQQADLLCKREDVQGPNKQESSQNLAFKKNQTKTTTYEQIKWGHLLGPKKEFIASGKATEVSKNIEIIYCFLPLSKKWFMVSSSFHLLLHSGNWATAGIYRYKPDHESNKSWPLNFKSDEIHSNLIRNTEK